MSRPSSTKIRRECFERNRYTDPVSGRVMMDCYLCGVAIDVALSATRNSPHAWEAEHVIRRVLSKDDSPSNILPAHVSCHKPKTARDTTENSKGKRVHDKHYGITRKQGFRKPPEGYEYSWKAKRYVRIGEDVE